MHRTSPFIDPASVEAWDSWFRWRERGRLRDLDVEATWRRVVTALTSSPQASPPPAELLEACASWRLLLDERILASAGTPEASWPDDGLVALVNVPVFVRGRFGADAAIDRASLAQTARLAVTALDAAADAARPDGGRSRSLRIGLTGMADALALLGVGYGSEAGRRQAAEIARLLAQACLEAGVRLACDRGADPGGAALPLERARLRGWPAELMRDLARHGVRYASLTAITAQPRLALLANNVSDGLDPLPAKRSRVFDAAAPRAPVSGGYALNLRRTRAAPPTAAFATGAELPPDAIRAMRAAVQPWIDAPIAGALTPPSSAGVPESEAVCGRAGRSPRVDSA
ncbi:MAG TPA: hypothetical protein VMR06_04480 [Dokdonella sp.]|uniref:hypothetical protein n=1 Tax=Dokdonella sp. TaxID=2291710 RepID=UPI002CCEE189|nr:hypothetical protein [Dokdonella sp.]HUD41235.1 hypothetical protein [Dokdonella sp.]